MNLAYSTIQIKSVDLEQRIIEGIASTPDPDAGGDVMDPAGAEFTLPMPFLWFHHQDGPIGEIFEATVRPDGIYVRGRVSKVDKPSRLKDLVDDAWAAFTASPPLVRGLSIGWKPIQSQRIPGTKFTRYLKWAWRELSAVTLPMNSAATILAVKSADLAATGRHSPPGVTGLPVVSAVKAAQPMATLQEQITSFESTRSEKFSKLTEIQNKASAEGRTKDEAERQESETLKLELKSIDAELVDLRDMLTMAPATATKITNTTSTIEASQLRGGANSVVQVKANVPKGTAFTRMVMAKVVGKNSISDAIRYVEGNQQWMDQTPEVVTMLKAAVNPGTIAEPAWAAPLAVTKPSNDFLELLRPELLLGKIPGLRKAEFNISMPVQTGGGTYQWVGEGAPKPVGNLQFSSVTLSIAKAAGIIVISEELAKLSTPDAEGIIRNDMIKGMRQYIDQQFITPTVAAVTNVSPASITNLANGFATAGTSADNARTDIKKGILLLTAAGYAISEIVIVMSESNAFALASALTTNGVLVNPQMSSKGGSIFGVPVVTSETAGNVVAFVHTQSILYADGGGVNIDVSREASVEMNTAPTSPVSASSAYVSLWQLNLIGLRADWFVNWKRARTTAVVYTTATYV